MYAAAVTADVLYLSPHADDAVFSAGGAIALAARAGRRVAVATVFSDGADAAARRAEDAAALARLGAARIDLGLVETPPGAGLRGLFAAPDPARVAAVRAALAPLLAALPDGAELHAPLAVGGHVDHRAVYTACAGLPRARFYEDQPYGQCPSLRAHRLGGLPSLREVARWWRRLPLLRRAPAPLRPLSAAALAWAQLRAAEPAPALTVEEVDVAAALDDKMAAVAAYQSQWPLFFADLAAARAALGPVERRYRRPP